MKNCSLILILLGFAWTAFAQSPQAFQYQAVVRNAAGDVIGNEVVGMRITLYQGVPPGPGTGSGSIVYQETHTPTSNTFGLVNLQVGMGTVVSGTFSAINWAMGPYFIEVEVDPDGGTNYTVIGSSQLLSVPYALYAENTNGITGGYYRGDTLKLTRMDGSVIDILPCGVDELSSQVTFNCLDFSIEGNEDLVEVAINYTGLDDKAVIVNNGMGTIAGDDPAITPNGTILVTGLREGDSWNFALTGGLNGSCLLESSGTVPANYCVPCEITSLATGGDVNIVCLTNLLGDNNDQVTLEIPYTGVDPDAVIINNGGGTIAGDDPTLVADGTILLTGLMVGDSWDISITGGASGGCNLHSSGTVGPAYLCNPCGITSLETGSQVPLPFCQTQTPGFNNDELGPLSITYTGMDPFAVVVNNGPGTLVLDGGNPATDMDGAFSIIGLKEGDTWDVSIIGGYNNACVLNSTGTIPTGHCSDPQLLLANGYSPCEIVSAGQPATDLYGKMHQGGLIFHVDVAASPCYTLVAAPADAQPTTEWWGCNSVNIATSTAVGTGVSNTANMLTAGCSQAANKVDQYSFGGYTDYVLPSKDELQLMHDRLYLQGLGNFKLGISLYWSSSQASALKAWGFKFSSNSAEQGDKTGVNGYLRGIRKF